MYGMHRRLGVAAWRKALHLRMRRLRQADLGHGRHNPAWFEAAFDRMVLGHLSHGHPFEWDFGAAIAKATRARLLQVRVAAVRQAAPRHGRAGPRAARWPCRGRRDRDPVQTQDRSGLRRRLFSPQGKMFVAGAVEVENDAPGRLRLAAIKDFSAASLHGFVAANVAPGATIKPTAGRPMPAPPTSGTSPMSSAPWPPMSFCPGSTAPSPTPRPGRSASITDCEDEHLQSYLDEFAFRFNRRRTRHAAFRSLLAIALVRKPLTYNMLIMPEVRDKPSLSFRPYVITLCFQRGIKYGRADWPRNRKIAPRSLKNQRHTLEN